METRALGSSPSAARRSERVACSGSPARSSALPSAIQTQPPSSGVRIRRANARAYRLDPAVAHAPGRFDDDASRLRVDLDFVRKSGMLAEWLGPLNATRFADANDARSHGCPSRRWAHNVTTHALAVDGSAYARSAGRGAGLALLDLGSLLCTVEQAICEGGRSKCERHLVGCRAAVQASGVNGSAAITITRSQKKSASTP